MGFYELWGWLEDMSEEVREYHIKKSKNFRDDPENREQIRKTNLKAVKKYQEKLKNEDPDKFRQRKHEIDNKSFR